MKDNKSKWVLGHKITPYHTTGSYDLVLGETPAKVQGPPPHLHHTFNEVFLLIEGEMEFMLNGAVKTYKAGECIDIPPGTLHTFSNKSDQPCKWINIHSPKGFRKFFDDLGVSVDDPNAQEKSVAAEIIQEVIKTAENYDMIFKK